jgi:aminomethyltransferase
MPNDHLKPTAKRTPLYDSHKALGAKIVEFAGWDMPVEYEGLRAEHLWVRSHVGIFDVSHMGEIRVRGPKALETLEWTTTNHVAALQAGQAQYSLFPNFEGGVVDDLIVYCVRPGDEYFLCVNAANVHKDFEWLVANNRGADLTNESAQWGQIAVQGPEAVAMTGEIFGFDATTVGIFHWSERKFEGASCYLARTGYTGEDGFEIFVSTPKTLSLWTHLLKAGAKPIGLGARDTLRTEMKMSLYGHELDDRSNPYRAGLGWVVKPNAKDFIGRSVIVAAKEQGLTEKLVGLKMVDRAIARHGYEVCDPSGAPIGRITSGTPSPSLNENIGIAYVNVAFSKPGCEVAVNVRGRLYKAVVVATPFVRTTSLHKK